MYILEKEVRDSRQREILQVFPHSFPIVRQNREVSIAFFEICEPLLFKDTSHLFSTFIHEKTRSHLSLPYIQICLALTLSLSKLLVEHFKEGLYPLQQLKELGFECIGYANDVILIIRGKFDCTVCNLLQRGLRVIEREAKHQPE